MLKPQGGVLNNLQSHHVFNHVGFFKTGQSPPPLFSQCKGVGSQPGQNRWLYNRPGACMHICIYKYIYSQCLYTYIKVYTYAYDIFILTYLSLFTYPHTHVYIYQVSLERFSFLIYCPTVSMDFWGDWLIMAKGGPGASTEQEAGLPSRDIPWRWWTTWR